MPESATCNTARNDYPHIHTSAIMPAFVSAYYLLMTPLRDSSLLQLRHLEAQRLYTFPKDDRVVSDDVEDPNAPIRQNLLPSVLYY